MKIRQAERRKTIKKKHAGIEGLLRSIFNEPWKEIITIRSKGYLKHPCRECKKRTDKYSITMRSSKVVKVNLKIVPPTARFCTVPYGRCFKVDFFRRKYIQYILYVDYLFRNNDDHVLSPRNLAVELHGVNIDDLRDKILKMIKNKEELPQIGRRHVKTN